LHHQIALPRRQCGRRHVLQGAATTPAEVRARRRHPIRTWRVHRYKTGGASIAARLGWPHGDPFAGQHEGDIKTLAGIGPSRDTVTTPTDTLHHNTHRRAGHRATAITPFTIRTILRHAPTPLFLEQKTNL
jgi:hypothetical protein